MKSQRLLDVLGEVSPAFVAEAAPGNIPCNQRRKGLMKRKLAIIVAAALMLVALTAIVLGTGASATPGDGRPISDIPRMMLPEDYERFVSKMEVNLAGTHEFERFKAYYVQYDLSLQMSDRAKAYLLEQYPILEVTPIYAIDSELLDSEVEAITVWLTQYGGFTQQDLIDAYTRLHEAVLESDIEDKEAALATLPAIPVSEESQKE